jgi:tetratricopeptide (TPR) repeat protein
METLKPLLLSCVLFFSFGTHAQQSLRDSAMTYFENQMKVYGLYSAQIQGSADTALLIDPTQDEIWRERAIPYLKRGDFETWVKYINKAVEYNPKKWLSYRAFCRLVFMKDYDEALKDFEMAEKYNKNAVEYVMDHTYDFYKGLCYLETNRLDLAKKHFQKSVDYQLKERGEAWTHYADLFYLGMSHHLMNDNSRALHYLDMSLKLYAQFPDANYYKALILKSLNRQMEALDHLLMAQKSIKQGYRMNEDNEIYANYPLQMSLLDVEKQIETLKK